jgi:hypothetical protein
VIIPDVQQTLPHKHRGARLLAALKGAEQHCWVPPKPEGGDSGVLLEALVAFAGGVFTG